MTSRSPAASRARFGLWMGKSSQTLLLVFLRRGEPLPGADSKLIELQACPGDPLIQMLDVVKTFKNPAGEFTALKGISACFYPCEFVSVVGKSGSGKSTLVNMLTGIDHPTRGTVRV